MTSRKLRHAFNLAWSPNNVTMPDVVRLPGVHAALRSGERALDASLVAASGGPERRISLRHDLSSRQADLLLAGGAINWLRARLEPGRAGAQPGAPALPPG